MRFYKGMHSACRLDRCWTIKGCQASPSHKVASIHPSLTKRSNGCLSMVGLTLKKSALRINLPGLCHGKRVKSRTGAQFGLFFLCFQVHECAYCVHAVKSLYGTYVDVKASDLLLCFNAFFEGGACFVEYCTIHGCKLDAIQAIKCREFLETVQMES